MGTTPSRVGYLPLMKVQPLLLASAVLLMTAGIAGLFVPQEIAVWLGIPSRGAAPSVVQLLAGALFALGMLDWMHRFATVGGVFGRPVVAANLTFFFIAATTLVRAAAAAESAPLWAASIACGAFAIGYGRLFFGGRRREAAEP